LIKLNGKSAIAVLVKNKQLLFGLLVIVLVALVALIAPYLAMYNPTDIDILNRFKHPSTSHLFGTDGFGRDIFSRVIFGTRTSMLAGMLTMLFTLFLGGLIGLTCGYYKGLFDSLIMRFMDTLMAFPSILLAVALMAVLGSGLINVILSLSIVYTPRLARIVRSEVLSIREQPYIEAAQAMGASVTRVLCLYVLPQTIPIMLVQGSFIFAYGVIAEAALSFLGIGTPPPMPSWGNILSDGRSYLSLAPWITIFPGLAIVFIVLGLNLVGDCLRDVLDPRLKNVG